MSYAMNNAVVELLVSACRSGVLVLALCLVAALITNDSPASALWAIAGIAAGSVSVSSAAALAVLLLRRSA